MYNPGTLEIIKSIEVTLLVIPAMLMDIKSLKIRNYLTIPAMLAGILTNSIAYGFNGLTNSISGVVITAGILIILYLPRYIGAGDVKFFSAIGAIMGTLFSLKCIIAAFLLGGVIGIIYMILRKKRFPFMIAAAPAVLAMLILINRGVI